MNGRYRYAHAIHHISSAGDGDKESDEATDSRGLKYDAVLQMVTAVLEQSPTPSAITARSNLSSSLHAQQ